MRKISIEPIWDLILKTKALQLAGFLLPLAKTDFIEQPVCRLVNDGLPQSQASQEKMSNGFYIVEPPRVRKQA